MLVKLAFAMQKLRKHKKIGHDQQRCGEQFLDFVGGHSYYEGGHIDWGSPTGENPGS